MKKNEIDKITDNIKNILEGFKINESFTIHNSYKKIIFSLKEIINNDSSIMKNAININIYRNFLVIKSKEDKSKIVLLANNKNIHLFEKIYNNDELLIDQVDITIENDIITFTNLRCKLIIDYNNNNFKTKELKEIKTKYDENGNLIDNSITLYENKVHSFKKNTAIDYYPIDILLNKSKSKIKKI